jgi:hypothetical protein
MESWAGFWDSDTHELKQIAEETGVVVGKFQDVYEAMYPSIHQWERYSQAIEYLERSIKWKSPETTDYEKLYTKLDHFQSELHLFCTSFNIRGEVVRVPNVPTPRWLRDVPGVLPWPMFIFPVLCSFNRYLLEKTGYAPGFSIPVEWEEPPKWWKFWDYKVKPYEPWSPPSYTNRLIIAFRTYLEYQGIHYRPYLDDAHAFHHWTPPKYLIWRI